MRVEPNYSTEEVIKFTYDMVKYILDNNIKGSLVECGVATGNQLGAMQLALEDNGSERNIYGFDSFQGIPYASEHDTEQPGIGAIDPTKLGLLESSGITVHAKQHVLDNFNRWKLSTKNLKLVEGWFEHTVDKTKTGQIAMLRLDGDLYSSTKVCLEHLLKRVVKGGVIIIDDWNLSGCRKAVYEYIPKSEIKEIHGIAYVIK